MRRFEWLWLGGRIQRYLEVEAASLCIRKEVGMDKYSKKRKYGKNSVFRFSKCLNDFVVDYRMSLR